MQKGKQDKLTSAVLLNTNPAKFSQIDALYNYDSAPRKDFSIIIGQESHTIRRRMILEKHPEIKKFMNPDRYITLVIAIVVVVIQFANIILFHNSSWPVYLFTAYFFQSMLNRTLHVLVHDLTHNLGHSNPMINKIFAIICNIPTGLPGAMSFAKYHAEHHNFMGIETKDPDLPLRIQARLIRGKFLKFLFILNMPIVYLFRPLLFRNMPLKEYQPTNVVVIMFTNFLIYYYLGISAIGYMIIGVYFSLGFNVGAMHMVAEHYEFVKGQESYDYLGPFNILNLNIGYHIEHHDFPTVPWYYLPEVRKAAPQFYENLPYHTSYLKVMLKFIMDDGMDLYHRVLRTQKY